MSESTSILQWWVTELGLRHQGVLLTAVRGCDTWSKYSPEKPLIREIRGLILNPYDPRELEFDRGFMTKRTSLACDAMNALCDNVDGLPVHYIMHLLHAMEILGYCHPDRDVREDYQARYLRLSQKFHLNPETEEQMHARLGEDRIQSGTVEL